MSALTAVLAPEVPPPAGPCPPLPGDVVLGTCLPMIDDAEVRQAARMINTLPAVTQLQEAITKTLGRKRKLSVQTLFIGLLLTAVHGESTVLRRVYETLQLRISQDARTELGLPRRPRTRTASDAGYRALLRVFHAVIEVVNPSAWQVTRALVLRTEPRPRRKITRAEQQEAAETLLILVNDLLEQTWQQLPAEVRAQWNGDLGLDATPIPAYSRGRNKYSHHHSAEPDGGWYVREGDHRDRDSNPDPLAKPGAKKPSKHIFGFEASTAVPGSRHLTEFSLIPRLVLAVTLHKPGQEPGLNGFAILRDLHRRGHPAGLIGADRNYNNAEPTKLQLPSRALGYGWLFDYRDDQLGVRASNSGGAIQVEGSWYCPSMPEKLIKATILFRAKQIDEATWKARIHARTAYLLRPKGHSDTEGHQRHLCPASGTRGCTALCSLKTHPAGWKPAHPLPVVFPVSRPVKELPLVCDQDSITTAPTDGAKFAQDLQYGTDEQQAAYRSLRQAVEGQNSYIKDGSREGLADPTRRRVRGIAAQTLLSGFLLAANNLRAIRSWLARAVRDNDGVLKARKRRRRTSLLSEYNDPGTPIP